MHQSNRKLENKLLGYLPEGWQQIGNLLVCPEHEIKTTLFIDGKEVT
jgi:hypothetical protein